MIEQRKSGRLRTQKRYWDDIHHTNYIVPKRKKQKDVHLGEEQANNVEVVEPVIMDSVDSGTAFDDLLQHHEFKYIPPRSAEFRPWRPLLPSTLTPIELFLQLFGPESMHEIATNTNEYAACKLAESSTPTPRNSVPTTADEVRQYIGLLFYMGRHPEFKYQYYWRDPVIQKTMKIFRWEQLNRYLTVNPAGTPPDQCRWNWRIMPLADRIRINCQTNVVPATWISIDEVMIAFQGRPKDITSTLGKPIDRGYKV